MDQFRPSGVVGGVESSGRDLLHSRLRRGAGWGAATLHPSDFSSRNCLVVMAEGEEDFVLGTVVVVAVAVVVVVVT